MNKKILSVLVTILLFNSAIAQTSKRALKATDVNNIPTLQSPALSPDGKWLVYELSEVDTAKDNRVSHLWMQSFDGKQSIQLTYGDDLLRHLNGHRTVKIYRL